ncbi:MAG: M14 family zinc carboxypeptidase [Alphaproteobacteria bacterium]|nr:M14 family zinc carboxypeptidase [Alphaproteobacteria bacterium]
MMTIGGLSLGQVQKLARQGLDIGAVRKGAVATGPRGVPFQSYDVEAVVSSGESERLKAEGFRLTDIPGKGPVHKIGTPYEVYRSFDEPIGGIRAQISKIHADYPDLVQVTTIGKSLQGRPILALRLTNKAAKGAKPEVLFVATTHAREWVSTEVAMRLARYLLANHGSDARVTDLLDTTEIWIIPVVNPDGYQYTFTDERLWRKNLRDNDGDGVISTSDGVDINRNFNSHWGYDDEGSSPALPDAAFRGTAPESEPETRAQADFVRAHDFKFVVSYHTYGNLILYPWGWQVKTPSLDDAIFVAQAGTDSSPAIYDSLLGVGYDPGVGADLYITNGDFTDWAYNGAGVPGHTVELTDGYDFRFPDDEGMVQTVFEDNLEFALALAESAHDPANPVSPVGLPAQDLYHTPVAASWGTEQQIIVVARKGLGLELAYNDMQVPFPEQLGERYNVAPGVYYSRYVATVSGQEAGNSVTYSIRVDGAVAESHSYVVESATSHPILVMAAEDYSGSNPTYHPANKPHYLSYYEDALDAGGYYYDVWDVDQQGIPSYQDVLSHYDTVIWYTGDDYAATVPNGLSTHEDETLQIRDMMNFGGGKVFATGQDLAWLSSVYGYSPDDFFQYYLGAISHIEEGGVDPNTGEAFAVKGVAGDPVFGGLEFSLNGRKSASNQAFNDTFLATSGFINQEGEVAARYDRPGGPFDPHTGSYYVYSQMADVSYKRLGGTFTLPAGSPKLRFWMSYDIETDWDFAFVEVSVAGSGLWTTLPDANGATAPSTGDSCPAGWVDQIHPFLANYMDAGCNPTGATGAWHAFTGNSGGWRQVEIDLAAYAGMTVELYISYASDWSVQNLGVFVDDIELAGYPAESFETGYGDWSPQPGPDSAPFNNWNRIEGAGFPEGPAIRTSKSVYLGFGFEGIATQESRNAVMDRVMQYLDGWGPEGAVASAGGG